MSRSLCLERREENIWKDNFTRPVSPDTGDHRYERLLLLSKRFLGLRNNLRG